MSALCMSSTSVEVKYRPCKVTLNTLVTCGDSISWMGTGEDCTVGGPYHQIVVRCHRVKIVDGKNGRWMDSQLIAFESGMGSRRGVPTNVYMFNNGIGWKGQKFSPF